VGPVSEQGFFLNVDTWGKEDNRQIAFHDVKAVKSLERSIERESHRVRHVTLIVAGVIGIAALVFLHL
jgi:hypothetical protein